jgi:hypothetical protein
MRGAVCLAMALALAATPAFAERLVCAAKATGKAGEVSVDLTLADGKITEGRWSWRPPSDPSSTPAAMLSLSRGYLDVETGRLGPFDGLVSFNVAPFDPPKVERAIVGASSNTVKPVFRVWRLYGEAAADLKAGRPLRGAPPGARPAAFGGAVPFSRQDEDVRPLLDSLTDARTVITSVTDEKGKVVVSRGLFWLTDRAGSEALGAKALADAKSAAADPARCKPAPA